MSTEQKKSSFMAIVREWTESIVVALVLAVFIRTYFFQPFKIPSGSMRMTLVEGDHLFVNKLRYGPMVLPELHSPEFMKKWFGTDFDIQWPNFVKPLTKIRLPGFGQPARGDIMVFVYPQDRSKDFIKRLVGMPGDKLEIRDGGIYVNGQQITDPKILNTYYYNRGDWGQEGETITIPEGHYFMLGDNSASSHDSRYWGFIKETDIIGKADLLFWPLDRIRLIK
jgi:signal peptidase I